MSDRVLVNALLVVVAVVLSAWGWQASDTLHRHAAEVRELREQVESCRRLHSRAAVLECASGWEDALDIAKRCAADLDKCRKACP